MILISCKKHDVEKSDFDKSKMLKSIADEQITPLVLEFKLNTEHLNQSIQNFCSTPNLSNLDILQADWVETSITLEKCLIFNVGTIQDSYVFNKMESRPVNSSFIEFYISDTVSISNSFIESIGSSSKGLSAIEYLIYNELDDEQIVIDSFSLSSYSARRIEYLSSLGENLLDQSLILYNTWNNGYYSTFISYDGNNIGGVVSDLINEISSILEVVHGQKLGFPLGKDLVSSIAQPDDVESPLSHQSLSMLRANIDGIESIFFNDISSSSIGFDDYLNSLNARYYNQFLSIALKVKFKEVNDALDKIEQPLEIAVINQYEDVEEAYNLLRELLVMFKVDVASQLSITITLNDNDGD
ncbi:MAG: imelysin family protein [Flavobacteriales bacterium]|nr:imelysin family protein [Flavobacteriales bacterium]